jgi:hypothetical protein
MFTAPELVFDYTDDVGSRFYVLRARTHFRRDRGRRVPFSCLARPDSHSAVRRASGLDLMFCAPGLIFGGNEGIVTRFHILRARTRFRWCLVRRVPISCFARPFSFSAVPMAFGPVIMFCSPRLIFGGTEGVGSRFNVLRVRTCFLWYRGRPNSFSAVSSVSCPYFMFCAPVLVFSGTEGVGSRFHVLLSGLIFSGTEGVGSRFNFLLPGLVFGGTEVVGSRLHVLRSLTQFRRYRRRRVSFSCFARPDSFSAVPRASGTFFMFCAHIFVFGSTESVQCRFHVLRARTRFRRYRGRRVPFLCFARPDSFSAVPRVSGAVFMFCAPGLIFDATEGVGSSFHVLPSRTRFRRYRWRRVPFS